MGIVKIENTTVGVSPDGISSVAADTPIPHQAIMSSAAMNVYYMALAASWGYLETAPAPPDDDGIKRMNLLDRFNMAFGLGKFGLHFNRM